MTDVACFAANGCGSRRDNDIDLEPDELGRDLGEALAASLRPAILDRDGAALDPAEFAQPLHKSGGPLAPGRRRGRAQEPDGRQLCRLLRARRERPRRRRAAEQRDELAPSHSITSSARASSGRRHVEAERLGGLEVDDQLEFGRLLDRQVGRLLALENAAGVDASLLVRIRDVGPVAHQSADFGEFAVCNIAGTLWSIGEQDQLHAPASEEAIAAHKEGVRPLAQERGKRIVDLAAGAGVEDLDLHSPGAGGLLQAFQIDVGVYRVGGIFTSTAKLFALGTSSCRSSSPFGATATFNEVIPVTLLLGPI